MIWKSDKKSKTHDCELNGENYNPMMRYEKKYKNINVQIYVYSRADFKGLWVIVQNQIPHIEMSEFLL